MILRNKNLLERRIIIFLKKESFSVLAYLRYCAVIRENLYALKRRLPRVHLEEFIETYLQHVVRTSQPLPKLAKESREISHERISRSIKASRSTRSLINATRDGRGRTTRRRMRILHPSRSFCTPPPVSRISIYAWTRSTHARLS